MTLRITKRDAQTVFVDRHEDVSMKRYSGVLIDNLIRVWEQRLPRNGFLVTDSGAYACELDIPGKGLPITTTFGPSGREIRIGTEVQQKTKERESIARIENRFSFVLDGLPATEAIPSFFVSDQNLRYFRMHIEGDLSDLAYLPHLELAQARAVGDRQRILDCLHLPESVTRRMEGGHSTAAMQSGVPLSHLVLPVAAIVGDRGYDAIITEIDIVKSGHLSATICVCAPGVVTPDHLAIATNKTGPSEYEVKVFSSVQAA